MLPQPANPRYRPAWAQARLEAAPPSGRLDRLAARVGHSTIWRHGLFLAATIVTIAFLGYHFGTGDQVLHIPFLKQAADPSLYPNDSFFELRHQHYSYFWYAFVPVYRAGLLEITLFGVHCAATYLAFWALWTLSDELFGNPLSSFLGVVAMIFPHVGFAGWPVFEFSLLNRTFVFPWLLLALTLFLRGRYWLCFALLGLLYNLHVLSVNFALAMVLLASVMEWRRVGWRNLAVGLALFVVCALPVLIWKGSQSPIDLSLRPAWLDLVARSTLANIFYLVAPIGYVLLGTVSGLASLVLFFIARRAAPSPRHDRVLTWFVVAVIIIVTVALLTQWLPVTILVQSQISRAGVFALVPAYLSFAHMLAVRRPQRLSQRAEWWLLYGGLAGSVLAVVPVILWALQRWLRPGAARLASGMAVYGGMLVITVIVALRLHLWAPGLHVFAPRTPWVEAQLWARDFTPKTAVFIAAPHYWWLYDSSWRVFSERSTVAELADLLEIAFTPEYLDEWRPRYEALVPGALEAYQGDLMANWDIGARAFYGLSDEALAAAARQHGASYLVVDNKQSPSRPWPVVYTNTQYTIYDLRAAGRSP